MIERDDKDAIVIMGRHYKRVYAQVVGGFFCSKLSRSAVDETRGVAIVLLDQWRHVECREMAVIDKHPSLHDGVVGVGRLTENQRGQWIVQSTGQAQTIEIECGEVRGFAFRQCADVVSAQCLRTADSRQFQNLTRAQSIGAVCNTLQQHGLTCFRQHVRSIIRRRPIDTQPDGDLRRPATLQR